MIIDGVSFVRGQDEMLRDALASWLEVHGVDDYGWRPTFMKTGVSTIDELIHLYVVQVALLHT